MLGANSIGAMSLLIKIGAVLVLAMPTAFVLTIATFRFWRWIDVNTDLESFGHSGPADWCFYLVYAILVTVSFATWFFLGGKSED